MGLTYKVFTLDLRDSDTNLSKGDCNAFTSDLTATGSSNVTVINPSGLGSKVSGASAPFDICLICAQRLEALSDSGGALLGLLLRGGPAPRKKLVEAIVGPEIDEATKDVGKPSLRIDAG